MNIISANEIKKHGVSAIEKQLKHGPIHVLKHNQPLFVVISESDYQLLTQQKNKPSGLFAMLKKDSAGKRSKKDIDKQLQEDRDQWQ